MRQGVGVKVWATKNSGKTGGGTNYHNRYILVPQRLYVEKPHGGATEVVLRREAADLVSVVALH